MDKIKSQFQDIYNSIPFWWVVFLIGAVEIVSFAGSQFEIVNTIAFVALVLVTLYYSVTNLKVGLFILFAELFISSKGYLFAMPIGGFPLSIRLALFLTVFIGFAVHVLRKKEITFFKWPLWKEYTALVAVIGLGAVVGFLRDNSLSNIFFDANGYLYLGLILPVTQAIKSKKDVQQLFAVLFASVVAIGIETLMLLAAFSQIALIQHTLMEVYRWVRDTGVGEITRFPSGFSRIFFQSHIYMLIAFFYVLPFFVFLCEGKLSSIIKQAKDKTVLGMYSVFALSLLVIFLSYSRSFWVAAIGVYGLLVIWIFFYQKQYLQNLKKIIGLTIFTVMTFAFTYAVAFGIVNVPLPGQSGVSARALLADRTTDLGSEDAASSRMQLLKPLAQKSIEHPIIGSGLGTTVTYISNDPRVREESPDGSYTTYAFEWGYLDLLLKFGIIGFVVYAWMVWRIIVSAWKNMRTTEENHVEMAAIISTILVVLATHMFTPYLNHPLGIGWILIASVAVTVPYMKKKHS